MAEKKRKIPVQDRRRVRGEGEVPPELREWVDRAEEAERRAEEAEQKAEEAARRAEDAERRAEEFERRAEEIDARLREFAEAFQKYKDEHDAVVSRLERDRETRIREGVGNVFRKILDALDNLERALAHAAEDDPLADGVRLVHRQILDAMESEGLERLDVLGKPFDPAVAEAVGMVPVDDESQGGKVVEELRPGYRFHDRVLRPAQVRVGQYVARAER